MTSQARALMSSGPAPLIGVFGNTAHPMAAFSIRRTEKGLTTASLVCNTLVHGSGSESSTAVGEGGDDILGDGVVGAHILRGIVLGMARGAQGGGDHPALWIGFHLMQRRCLVSDLGSLHPGGTAEQICSPCPGGSGKSRLSGCSIAAAVRRCAGR